MIDHFWRLRLPWTATDDEIHAAYHRLALDVHPDRAPADASARERARRTTAMARLNESFAVLDDPETRARHRAALERQRAARTRAIPRRSSTAAPHAATDAAGATSASAAAATGAGTAGTSFRRPPGPAGDPTEDNVWRSPFDDLGERYASAKAARGPLFWLAVSLRGIVVAIAVLVRACADLEPAPDSTPSGTTVIVTAPAAPPTTATP